MRGFDVMLAVPPSQCSPDLYRQHQAVWSFLSAGMTAGERFLYAWEQRQRGAIVRARVPRPMLSGAPVNLPATGQLQVQMLAGRRPQASKTYRALEDSECAEWFREKMADSGFSLQDVAFDEGVWIAGVKMGATISLPVRQFRARYAISDLEAARRTWMTGVGRGRRFGCGMLAMLPPLTFGI